MRWCGYIPFMLITFVLAACGVRSQGTSEQAPDIEATVAARVEATVQALLSATPVQEPGPVAAANPPTATPLPALTPGPAIAPTAIPIPAPTPLPAVRDVIATAKRAVVRIETEASQGSGVIIDPNGKILTANHLVKDIDRVDVFLTDGRVLLGLVKGRYLAGDIALVEVSAINLPFVPLGNSDESASGDTLIKLGYALGLGNEPTATTGIVSAARKNERLDVRYLQTDAALNPGDSGGPMLNSIGELIGISSSKLVGEGIDQVAYAVAINEVKDRLNVLSHGVTICPPIPNNFEGNTYVTQRFAFSILNPSGATWVWEFGQNEVTSVGSSGRATAVLVYPPLPREGYATLDAFLDKGILGDFLKDKRHYDSLEVQRVQPTCLPTIGDALEVDATLKFGSSEVRERWLLFFSGSAAYFMEGYSRTSQWAFNEPFIDRVLYSFRFCGTGSGAGNC